MQDIPLLVEGGMAARFPLVVVVHADARRAGAAARRAARHARGRRPRPDRRASRRRGPARGRRRLARQLRRARGARRGGGRAVGPAAGALRRRPRCRPGRARLAVRRRPRPGVACAGRPARRARRGRGGGAGPGCRARRRRRPCPACPPRTSSTCCSGWRRPPTPTRCAGRSPRWASSPGRRRLRLGGSRQARPLRVRVVGSPGGADALRAAGLVAGRAAGQGRGTRVRIRPTREAAAAAWAASSGWAPSLNGTTPDS